jgi:glutamyl-tRNA synthetase
MTVRTRFAPSPTGYLHIGGVRTALFNWLYARRHGGRFILRIDDTDAARNRAEAVQPILDGFSWLGLNWDEGPTPDGSGDSFGPHKPYFQSQRNDLYVSAAMSLVAKGQAYPDYTPEEEQCRRRALADRLKKPYVHRGTNRDVAPEENLRQYKVCPGPILLKVPEGERVVFDDHVRGRVEVASSTIRDPVLLRAPNEKGVCGALYTFATVVDEIDFGITHVIRAEEHLTNTAPQILIYKALGAPVPQFAHIPLVYYKDEKMSKRDLPPLGAEELARLKACGWTDEELKGRNDLNIATVAYYRELGYIPSALVNYLVRLGWALDATKEIFPLGEAIASFDTKNVTKAPGNFDEKKLFWVQSQYMQKLSADEKVTGALPYLRRARLVGDSVPDSTRVLLVRIAEAAVERIKLYSDFVFFAAPLLRDEPVYNPRAVADALAKPGTADRLLAFAAELRTLESFDAQTLLAAFTAFANRIAIRPSDLDGPVRVALTGETVGFGLAETMALLERDKVLARLERAAAAYSG